ncbi:uncharacterized protein LOC131048553 isoform X1 [Cryptomeria japonica]|uniref:uncharacterized protein LOC131048553 isoform X1 n=1 Tax=Cryptomeria japonica TaxID=3369 RepID=UPI0025AC425D|nr:uncharacterized protein LOC131048553 isoform X1 [Cryptomeria japonica]
MGKGSKFGIVMFSLVIGAVIIILNNAYGGNKEALMEGFRDMSEKLGIWAMPVYVLIHTVTLSLCLPYAVFFEAGAAILFGFFPGVVCVFTAKILGASLSFWIGRALFASSSSAMAWVQRNKYFHILNKGVARDGWKFVLLARFSPAPSYVINYALAAMDVRFFVDFLIPTIVGCLPMILQNASIGSLTSAAVVSDRKSKKQLSSYLFPLLGIASSVLISLRIKKYSSEHAILDDSSHVCNSPNNQTANENTSDSFITYSLESEDVKSGLRKRVPLCSTS